ncbi:MAG: universal stress protein [Candidatus Korobacteraceae bacterium]|jgi:nucleotide-binding universal stress UspA family protein
MRILCCLDGTNTRQVSHSAQMFFTAEPLTIALLTVIDAGPRRDMDRTRERFWRPPLRHGPLTDEMQDAERAVSEEILKTALGDLPQAETLLRQGLPELEIVNAAAEWKADVIVICPRAEYGEPPHIGPRSVGHVARFVLDHAPCPVLLLRPLAGDQFPIRH